MTRAAAKVGSLDIQQFNKIAAYFKDWNSGSKVLANPAISKSIIINRQATKAAEQNAEPPIPGLPPKEVKDAVEKWAVKRAEKYLNKNGFAQIKPHSSKKCPYDLTCKSKKGSEYFVEVKGTQRTGDVVSVYVTVNEKMHAKKHKNSTGLFLLHSINVKDDGSGRAIASGGKPLFLNPWEIEKEIKAKALRPVMYLYDVRTKRKNPTTNN